MSDKVCIVAGVGPGNGAAFTRKFAREGYRVAMLARTAERLEKLEAEIPGARGFAVDMSDRPALSAVIDEIRSSLGPADVVVHNGAGGAFNAFMDALPETLERNFQINVMSLMHLGQLTVPDMLEKGRGDIVVIGNTSAWRGKANFAAFAPTKAAQRILAQSMARGLGPKGIHVAYVVIDAVIDVPWARRMFADRPDDFFIRPDDTAETVYHLTQQAPSAWTFEVDLRPSGESW